MTRVDSYDGSGTDTRSESPSLGIHKCPHCSMVAALEGVITEHIQSKHSDIRGAEVERK